MIPQYDHRLCTFPKSFINLKIEGLIDIGKCMAMMRNVVLDDDKPVGVIVAVNGTYNEVTFTIDTSISAPSDITCFTTSRKTPDPLLFKPSEAYETVKGADMLRVPFTMKMLAPMKEVQDDK